MKKLLRVGAIKDSAEASALEERLQASLAPVQPRIEYVHELKRRLLKGSELDMIETRPPLIQKGVLAIAGVLSGSLLVALGVRIVIALRNSRGVQQLKSGMQGKKAAPINPAI